MLKNARRLRKNQTRAEYLLWQKIRRRQLQNFRFQRQVIVGNFIVDFMCYEAKIIIELDGGQHGDEAVKKYDDKRTAWLKKQGYKILRFWNSDVLDEMESVLETIIQQLPPIPSFPRKGGRSSLSKF